MNSFAMHATSKLKYSVAIPTYNGLHLLSETLKFIQHINRSDFEIVVFNNSDTQLFSDFNFPNDNRIKYICADSVLPHSASLNTALLHCKGDWVTYMGDDDFILPNIFDIYDSLLSSYPAFDFLVGSNLRYEWPGYSDVPNLSLPLSNNYTYHHLERHRYVSFFFKSMTLPSGGQCLFSSTLLELIRSRLGHFCPNDPVVEFYGVRAAAFFSKHCLFTNQPLYINGRANKSIGSNLLNLSSFNWSFESPNGYFKSSPYDAFNYSTISLGGLALLTNDLGIKLNNRLLWHVFNLSYCFSNARGPLLSGKRSVGFVLFLQALRRKPFLTIVAVPLVVLYKLRIRFSKALSRLDLLIHLPTNNFIVDTDLLAYLHKNGI